MKKIIFSLGVTLICSCAFSQTVKVSKDGKSAVQCEAAVPAKETPISKEDVLRKKTILAQHIAEMEKDLADSKIKLAEIQAVCDKLKYK